MSDCSTCHQAPAGKRTSFRFVYYLDQERLVPLPAGEPARQHSGIQSGGSGSLPRQRSGSQPLHKSGSLPEAGSPDPENVEDHFAKRVRHGDTAEVMSFVLILSVS